MPNSKAKILKKLMSKQKGKLPLPPLTPPQPLPPMPPMGAAGGGMPPMGGGMPQQPIM